MGATLAYNVVEAVIALASGAAADSIALIGFGLDSGIEVAASSVLLWRLSLLLGLYVSAQAGWTGVDVTAGLEYVFDLLNMNAPDVFGAFANPIRLRILNLLQEHKEICVCDLCEALGVAQPKVSRHLALLREARLVEVRRHGKWKFYSLAEAPTRLHRTLLRCVRTCLVELDELAADRERLAAIEPRVRCT